MCKCSCENQVKKSIDIPGMLLLSIFPIGMLGMVIFLIVLVA